MFCLSMGIAERWAARKRARIWAQGVSSLEVVRKKIVEVGKFLVMPTKEVGGGDFSMPKVLPQFQLGVQSIPTKNSKWRVLNLRFGVNSLCGAITILMV